MAASWIDRALAIRTVDADDVPTDGKFRIWKIVGATLVPDGDRLVITIAGGQLLSGGGGSVDLRDGGFVIDATAPILVSAAGGISIDVGDLTIETPYHVIAAQAPTLGAHLTNKAYVDALIAAGVPDPLTLDTLLLGSAIDASGNDIYVTATNWIETAVDNIEEHAGLGFLAEASTGYVSISAGAAAATGLADGEARINAAGLCGIYSGAAFEVIGETTVSLQGTGTYALHIGDGFGDGDLAASCVVNGTTVTLGGNATTLTLGNSSAACSVIASTWALSTTGGATLNGVPIRTDFKVLVASTANIADLTTVTVIDSVTLPDQALVLLKDQSTPTQNGLYRFTLSTTTLARASSFDNLAEYHLGTTVRAYAGTVGKGLAWFLEALSSSLPATWTAVPGGGGGGGSSITDGVATAATVAGAFVVSGHDDFTASGSGAITLLAASTVEIGGGGSAGGLYISALGLTELAGADLGLHGGAVYWTSGGGAGEVPGVGGFSGWMWDLSGGGVRQRIYDGNTLAATWLYEAAEVSMQAQGIAAPLVFKAAPATTPGTTSTGIIRFDCGRDVGGALTDAVHFDAYHPSVNPFLFLTVGHTNYNGIIDAPNTSVIVRGASGAELRASAGVAQLTTYGGPVAMWTSSRRVEMAHTSDGVSRITPQFPAAVTPPSGAATDLGSVTVPASSAGIFRGSLVVRVDASNVKIIPFAFGWNADASNVTTFAVGADGTAMLQGTCATVVGDITTSDAGLVATIRVANASGFKCVPNGLAYVGI